MEYTNQIVQNDMEELLKKPFPYEKLKGKNILVTGASGMLAAYLVYFFMYLNEKQDYGIKVKALVRNEKKAWEKFGASACWYKMSVIRLKQKKQWITLYMQQEMRVRIISSTILSASLQPIQQER